MPRRENNKRIDQILLFFVFFFLFTKKNVPGAYSFVFFPYQMKKKAAKYFEKIKLFIISIQSSVKCRIDSLHDWISQSQKNKNTKVSVC
jgi:hypothetical protein